jgi:hypothetical protein
MVMVRYRNGVAVAEMMDDGTVFKKFATVVAMS